MLATERQLEESPELKLNILLVYYTLRTSGNSLSLYIINEDTSGEFFYMGDTLMLYVVLLIIFQIIVAVSLGCVSESK